MLENHWYILGAGAIGSLFACQFERANIRSTLLVRSTDQASQTHLKNTCKAIDLTFLDGSQQHFSIQTQTSSQSSITSSTPSNELHSTLLIHQLILTTKAHQSQEAIDNIRSRLAEGAIIVVMQNGMGVAEQLQVQLPQCTVFVATTTEGAHRPTASSLIHAGAGETWIGNLPSNTPKDCDQEAITTQTVTAQHIAKQWQESALSIHYDHNITQRLWTKLAINCAINPLTVKYQCNNGALLANPEALHLMEKVCQELLHIMAAKNIVAPSDLFATVKQVAKNTHSNISSMLQDHRNHKPTEIHFINGYVVNEGKALNIPTPVNQALALEITNRAYRNHLGA